MTNEQIARAFALGATEGENGTGSLYIEGPVLYSYGPHWPLALRKDGFVYVNADRYSVTTSKHRSALLAALQATAQATRVLDAPLDQMRQLAAHKEMS